MTPDEAFIESIRETPDDDAPRLIYADWLDDHGQQERAEFIRVQCELARMDEKGPGRGRLKGREGKLLHQNGHKWRVQMIPAVEHQVFRRGFVDDASLNTTVFLDQAGSLYEQAPLLQGVRLAAHEPDIPSLAESPHLRRLKRLDLSANYLSAGAISALASSPHLAGLTTLDLSGNRLGDAGARALAGSPHLAGLTALILYPYYLLRDDRPIIDLEFEDLIHASGAAALGASPHLSSLTTLVLSYQAIGDAGLISLVDSPNCSGLTALNLEHNEIGATGESAVEHLVASPYLDRLQNLSLSANPIGVVGARALAAWPALSRLSILRLNRCDLTDAGAAAITNSLYLDKLELLDLRNNRISRGGRAARALRVRLPDRVLL
jgi:uncharacterized protein (TIGR02996 family)